MKQNNQPFITVEPPGSKAKNYLEECKNFLFLTENRAFPELVISEGEGAIVKDLDGNKYLDFRQSVTILGRGHPKHNQAVKRQLDKWVHGIISSALHESYLELAQSLSSIIPCGLSHPRFISVTTGTEACDVGIQLSRISTKRSIVMSYHGAYHGKTTGTLGLSTWSAQLRKDTLPLISEITYLPFPDCYRCPFGHEYPSCHVFCLKYIESLFETVAPPENVASIIIEPIQAHGGIRVPPNEYFVGLRNLCNKYEILLLVDEVYSGFGKTGKFFAIEHWIDNPDILCLGKAMGGGMPTGAVVAKKGIIDAAPRFHIGTVGAFGGHPVSNAATIAVIQILREEKLLENVKKMGNYFFQSLRSLSSDYDIIGDIRGKGLIIGIEFVEDKESKKPMVGYARKVSLTMFKKGLLSVNRGIYHQVLSFEPPLNVTPEQIDTAIEILDDTLKCLSKQIE